MKTTNLIAALLISAFALPVFAQTAATPGINQNQRNQEARIEQGARSGELTRSEANNLQRQQNQIQADKRAAKADGVVTRAERHQIKRKQHQANRAIHHKKHNARAA